MTIYSFRSAVSDQNRLQPSCGRDGRVEHPGNKVFLRHHMGRLLLRIGSILPQWLNGPELAHAARDIERMCWRELGYGMAPLFHGDVPPFLLQDENGHPTGEPLQEPMSPAELAARLAALGPSAPPGPSPVESNLQALARLLNFTQAESEWLHWSCCFTRFSPPTIALRSTELAWSVLTAVLGVSPDVIRSRESLHRLQVMGMLKAPPLGLQDRGLLLSDWLTCTAHFMDVVETAHPGAAELWRALQAGDSDGTNAWERPVQ